MVAGVILGWRVGCPHGTGWGILASGAAWSLRFPPVGWQKLQGRGEESEHIDDVLAAVGGIADQAMIAHVNDEVQGFERQLTDQHGQSSGNSMTSPSSRGPG